MFLLLLILAATEVEPLQQDHGALLSAVACNASSTARTAVISSNELTKKGMVAFGVSFTRSTATAVTMSCTTKFEFGGDDYVIQYCDSISSGQCISVNSSFSKTVSASGKWLWRFDMLGTNNVSCVFACVGGGGSDTLTVHARSTVL